MGFADDIAGFAAKTERKMDLAVRKIGLELFSRVILRSPVGNPDLWKKPRAGYVGGRFRANWQVAIGSIPNGTLDLNDASGTATISKASATLAGVSAGEVIYLINNLDYGPALEDGHSGQAPAGMVGLSVQEFQRIAEQIGFELVQI
jgi:hypothetical protein